MLVVRARFRTLHGDGIFRSTEAYASCYCCTLGHVLVWSKVDAEVIVTTTGEDAVDPFSVLCHVEYPMLYAPVLLDIYGGQAIHAQSRLKMCSKNGKYLPEILTRCVARSSSRQTARAP